MPGRGSDRSLWDLDLDAWIVGYFLNGFLYFAVG